MAGQLRGQIDFRGREVSAYKLDIPGFGLVDYTLPDEDDPALVPGDRIRITAEFVVQEAAGREKHNSEGVGTDSLKQIARLRAVVPECVNVESVLRREAYMAAWEASVAG